MENLICRTGKSKLALTSKQDGEGTITKTNNELNGQTVTAMEELGNRCDAGKPIFGRWYMEQEKWKSTEEKLTRRNLEMENR